ncbi:MAG: 4Fe-4S binding protein [Desulfobacterales bacterium]|nr:4Fe-4S binding protein [Desulfobacterales bacterium]MCP4161884.1 4Fe-4S binding protein [Deltaproteobacteria bacterium]
MHSIKSFFQNWKRRAVQLISLFFIGEWSFYGIFRCPYAVPYIGCGNCPVVQCPGRSLWMWSWILIGVSAIFMGRVFCGWICPGGLVSEILGMFSLMRNRIKGTLSIFLSYGKYIVLLTSLYFFFILNNPRWAIPIRTGEFFNSVVLTFEHADPIWIYKTATILVLLAIGIAVPHLWCRFLCPTGGALEIFNKISIFKYSMNENCNNCDKCIQSCAAETRPSEINCTNCGDCVETCKTSAIEIRGLNGRVENNIQYES